MTPPPRTPPAAPPSPAAGDGAHECGRPGALAGLASEVEVLRREFAALRGLPERVDEIAGLVARLTDTVATALARTGPTPAPSWLSASHDPEVLAQVLDDLVVWLHTVYLRYPDAVVGLPECWLYHPDVVEELLWLMHAWLVAYQSAAASVQLAGDWHDRQRPAVVRRIKAQVGTCSRERHMTRPDRDQYPTGAIPVPGVDAVASIAAWWATARDEPAPEPAPRPVAPATAQNGAPR
ncbi:hypothetical protein [Pseudonocardia sp.]|uniref:hypothetical protein n=1 Tax=Pseudonocardia sp. TaxID=60912 RepID=UPI00260BC0F9|nr:hypothetical protein [Pseudonocardia sp.]